MKLLIPRLVAVFLLASLALAACTNAASTPEKILPAQLEEIEGSEFKKVILTEKAAARIDLQTALVSETAISPFLRVGGEVVQPVSSGLDGAAPNAGVRLIRVRLTSGGSQGVDRGKLAAILPLTGGADTVSIPARSIEGIDVDDDGEDADDGDELFFEIEDDDGDWEVGERVFVELPLAETNTQRIVVPYAAILYGLTGETWVYVNTGPLEFVRYPIVIDYIEGDQAVLFEGPEVGASVVTVGVAELYGAETGVSK